MLSELKLNRIWVPSEKILTRNNFKSLMEHSNSIPQSDIYVSEDFTTNEEKLLCLVQGTGNVRAG